MSPFSRFMPHTLCCFYVPQHHEEPPQQSPVRQVPLVPRRPVPYAMINVPHEPEMTDTHTFRRLFTQSPACPHGDTPPAKKKSNCPSAKGSLDLEFTFDSGSPVPLPKKSMSLQKISSHIKQKMSDTRLSKSSSRAENHYSKVEDRDRHTDDPSRDVEAIMLVASATSIGLSDLLQSRSGSVNGYDSDARSIKTPDLRSAADTIKIIPVYTRSPMDESDPHLAHPVPAPQTFCQPMQASDGTAQVQKTNSPPFPHTPEKTSFGDASQLSGESPSMSLNRLSIGIASGSIKAPTTIELRSLHDPMSQHDNDAFRTSLQVPRRSSSLSKCLDTPQTVIERLSERVQHEKRSDLQTSGVDGRASNPIGQLDPALVEPLFPLSPSRSSGAGHDAISPVTAVKDEKSMPRSWAGDVNDLDTSSATSFDHSRTDLASVVSSNPSEERSVHLFNMQISQRLASKSTAAMLSPAASCNVSKKSLDISPPLPSWTNLTSTVLMSHPTRVRAEHNRRPSDPHTRQLFERRVDMLAPLVKPRSTSIDRSKVPSRERDDASSFYTSNGDPPSSSGNLSAYNGGAPPAKHPNSLAIGGRSASTEIPLRRSKATAQNVSTAITAQLLPRSLSNSATDSADQLELASEVINRYLDGSNDHTRRQLVSAAKHDQASCDYNQDILPYNSLTFAKAKPEAKPDSNRRASAGWLTDGQRSGWNYEFVHDDATPRPRRHSNICTVAPDVDRSTLKETANDTLNHVDQDANKQYRRGDPLATPNIEMDYPRRCSSVSTIRPRHCSIVLDETPRTASRTSSSDGVPVQTAPRQDDSSAKQHLSKTLGRLSFRHLHTRPKEEQGGSDNRPRKLQKRSSPELTKKASFADSQKTRMKSFRAGNTPPLKELLGLWGSFPSHDRAERNAAASHSDNVHARDFGQNDSIYQIEGTPLTPLNARVSASALSAMHITLRKLSIRSKNLDRKKSKSMSFPITPPNRVQRHSKAIFLERWKRLYRTKSPEWHDYTPSGGYRSSVTAGRPLEYPKLKVLPCEGLFEKRKWRTSNAYDVNGAPERATKSLKVESNGSISSSEQQIDTPTWPRVLKDRPDARSKFRGSPTLWESITFQDLSKRDPVNRAASPEPAGPSSSGNRIEVFK